MTARSGRAHRWNQLCKTLSFLTLPVRCIFRSLRAIKSKDPSWHRSHAREESPASPAF